MLSNDSNHRDHADSSVDIRIGLAFRLIHFKGIKLHTQKILLIYVYDYGNRGKYAPSQFLQ